MMTLEQFALRVKEKLPVYLPANERNCEIRLMDITKNNDTKLRAVMVRSEGSALGVNLYLDSLYEQYNKGRSMDSILHELSMTYLENRLVNEPEVDNLTAYDEVKDRIICRVCGMEQNQQYLSDKPFTQVEDLAVTYCILVDEDLSGGMATAAVTNNLMEQYGIGIDELHQTALQNTEKLLPAQVENLAAVLGEMMGEELTDMNPGMYVVSNTSRLYGAVGILRPETMDMVAEVMGTENFYVLPSSVHEILAVPKSIGMDYRELEDMVRSINASQVAPEERLSNHVYEVDVKEHKLCRCGRVEEKQLDPAKSKAPKKEERGPKL